MSSAIFGIILNVLKLIMRLYQMCGCAVTVNRLITPSLLHHIVVFFYCSYHCLFQYCCNYVRGIISRLESHNIPGYIYRPRVRIQYPDRICGGRIVSASVIDPGWMGFRGDRIRYDTDLSRTASPRERRPK